MELLKLDDRPAEFKFGEVTFFFRTRVSVGDRHQIINAGASYEGDTVVFKPWELYTKLIRIFVTSWKGVTLDGKEVPYSYDALMTRLPADMTQDVITKLGLAIAEVNGFIPGESTKQVEALKNA